VRLSVTAFTFDDIARCNWFQWIAKPNNIIAIALVFANSPGALIRSLRSGSCNLWQQQMWGDVGLFYIFLVQHRRL